MIEYRESLEQAVLDRNGGEPSWVRQDREDARRRFRDGDFPNPRDEDWRTINLEAILKTSFEPAHPPATDALRGVIHPLVMNARDEARLVFVDGYYSEALSNIRPLPEGVIFQNLSAALKERGGLVRPFLGGSKGHGFGIFWDINRFQFSDGPFLYVPDGVTLEKPVHIVFVASTDQERPFVFYPRGLVVAGARARLQLITHGVGTTKVPYFMDSLFEIVAGEDSRLAWVDFQKGSEGTHQFLNVHCRLSRRSQLVGTAVHEEARLTRSDVRVDLNGEAATVSLRGLGLLRQDHELYQHLIVSHNAPSTTSRQHFRNVLVEKARSEFDSLVHVKRGSVKADSQQLNKNLLLSETARAYARPRLKIDTDDVKCNHGSTVGQLEGEELFYLRTRGLDEDVSRTVLTYGFAEEILQDLPAGKLKMGAENEVRVRLEAMVSGGKREG